MKIAILVAAVALLTPFTARATPGTDSFSIVTIREPPLLLPVGLGWLGVLQLSLLRGRRGLL